MAVKIHTATKEEAPALTDCVLGLLGELVPDRTFDRAEMLPVTERLLDDITSFTAFLAYDGAKCVGAITLTRCVAIYAKGEFGEIAELFVAPSHRGRKVGRALITAAVNHAYSRGWQRIEVGTPPEANWGRTIAFYKRLGFTEVGPRLKYVLE